MAAKAEKPIRKISSREVYRNPWCSVREDTIERTIHQQAQRGIYGVMDKDPACIVIPLEQTNEGDFIWLVRQYRYTVDGTYYELPQGGWEVADVRPDELARGELAEETGLRAERMTALGNLWIAYGAMRQIHHVFLAEGLTQGETARDPEEHDMTVHRVAVSEFEAMMLDGRVMDNCTVAAWGLYRVWSDRSSALR
ncbi:MAG: NUDIX hydrolase [Acidobacteria bacterium]|nr:NUDIX hydrolase [Acidobacteriota bacterium]